MCIEKQIKMYLSVFLLSFFCVSNMLYAEEQYLGNDTTTVKKSIDIEIGEVTQYQLKEGSSEIKRDVSGKERVTTTFDIGNPSEVMPLTDSSTSDIFSGWEATVTITDTIDETYAYLEEVFARWEQISGSTSQGESSLSYGQDLGTNSANGYEDMTDLNGIEFSTGFKPGKYGYHSGHKVGANMNAKIGGKRVEVICNVNL